MIKIPKKGIKYGPIFLNKTAIIVDLKIAKKNLIGRKIELLNLAKKLLNKSQYKEFKKFIEDLSKGRFK